MFEITSQSHFTGNSGPFGPVKEHVENPSDNGLQRADGSGRMVLSGSEKGTRIVDVFERSPIRIMFPGDIRGAVKRLFS